MWKLIGTIMFAGIVACAMPAWCEYYQYRDANGVLRFTDDIASVPPDQRPGVTTHRSVESSPVPKANGPALEKNGSAAIAATQQGSLSGDKTWEGRKAKQLADFDRRQAELDRMFTDLQNQRARLEAKAPSNEASFEEKAAYNQKVRALNAKINRYEEELAAFTQQVNAYNAQVKNE